MSRATAFRTHSSGQHRDEVQFAVAFKVVLIARLWRARFAERMSKVDQTDARWTTLCMIADAKDGITQTRLAEDLGMGLPTLVRHLDALEYQKLMTRRPDPHDKRAKIISILPRGREVLADVDRQAAELRDELFAGVADKDIETTLRVLKHVSVQLERDDPGRAAWST